ncbi:MAG: RecQ family ATP-dependent DNA helicase [bacterium]|nr:RecQ family ATP-dependent DNA helicase [bacterium]
MLNLEEKLHLYFGIDLFRPGQRSAVEAILAGRDVLALWPTGAGKSLVYQLASQILPHLTLVVTPLVSLMFDQVRRMHTQGIYNAACLTAAQSREDNGQVLEALRTGYIKTLFLTPERLNSDEFLVRLRGTPISLLTIDEAHCICQWGHDFRPDYLLLGKAIQVLQPRSILAMTATATPAAQEQIAYLLGLQNPLRLHLSLDRTNLHYSVQEISRLEGRQIALQHLYRRGGLPAVVYINQRQECETTARYFCENGLQAAFYHAGMRPDERQTVQKRFLDDELQVITATTAFGMGVDKPNVRQVIHLTPSGSLEEYYQESGRAGRDGQEAYCLLLYSRQSFERSFTQLEERYPTPEMLAAIYQALWSCSPAQLRQHFLSLSPASWRQTLNAVLGYNYQNGEVQQPQRPLESVNAYLDYLYSNDRQRLQAMQNYALGTRCRRSLLLEYFGEQTTGFCDKCDVCRPPAPLYKPSTWKLIRQKAQKWASYLAGGTMTPAQQG